MNNNSNSFFAGLILIATLMSACASSTPAQPNNVVIGSLGPGESTSTSGITREELEDHVRRFADRYMTRVGLAANGVRNETDEEELKALMNNWKSIAFASVVDIAIGPNAVTNLLDMMALTMLSRIMVESHWAPNVIGPELGPEFLETFVDLENDIWSVADDVLTQIQQEELKVLVKQWHAENPEQIYPWYVRLSDFSGQRAASLAAVQQTGGMLKEVARAREAAEEIQAFGERVLFYLQRAPMITSLEFESSANDVLGGPNITRAIDDIDRFVSAVEQLVDSVDDLPGSRLAAVDQIMDRIREERVALVRDLASSESDFVNLLTVLQPALDSLERLTASDENEPDSKPFDINEYRSLVGESATTAIELRRLVETVDSLMQNSAELSTLVEAIVEAENDMVDRAFMQAIALIFIFFVALLAYRLLVRRLIKN
jgi:hypothetical protein